MQSLREIRSTIISFVKKYENISLFILKFITGLVIYNLILGGNNYSSIFTRLNTGAFGFVYIVMLSFAFVLLPRTINYFIMIGNICISLTLYPLVALFVAVVLLSILVFYGRLAPKESFIALLTYFLFSFNAPYLIPLVAGLYFSAAAFIPIILGGFLYAFHDATLSTISLLADPAVEDMDFISQFIFINNNIIGDTIGNSPYFVIGFVLAISFLAVYFISKLTVDYNREVSILIGSIFSFVGLIFVEIAVNSSISLFFSIIMIILCGFIAYFITFFDAILDYGSSEKVLFQDNENVYFVKIVPKIDVE